MKHTIHTQSSFAPRAIIVVGALLASLGTSIAQDASAPLPPPSARVTDPSLSDPKAGATNTSNNPSRDRNTNTAAPMTPSSTLPASGASNTVSGARPDSDRSPMASGVNVNANASLNRGDRNFVTEAAKANAHEIAISRVAAERATRPEVRAFAQEILAAHQTADTGLSRLASNKAVTLDPVDADITKKWSDKKGDDLDEDYVKEMVSAHKKAVDRYEEAARDAKDTEIATFAREQIATLNAHLRKAQDLEKIVD